MSDKVEPLTAKQRIAELERDLDAARADLSVRDAKIASLEAMCDSLRSEVSALSAAQVDVSAEYRWATRISFSYGGHHYHANDLLKFDPDKLDEASRKHLEGLTKYFYKREVLRAQ